ncbi:Inner membrane transport protein YajR OS=Lysinibacillus sphaericus OX=1421 GN=yajR PE=4 SV=1 [Lysinibacillus sphaericus]
MKKFIYLIIFFSFFDLFTQLPVMSTYAESLGASAFLRTCSWYVFSF